MGDDSLGSTVVGTYGYMAPEQFRGAASPASDLYGLGGTLLYLLSGRPPSTFPVDRMRTDFSSGGPAGGAGTAAGQGGAGRGTPLPWRCHGPSQSPRASRCAVKMGARLEAVVEGLLEPVPEDRLPAEDALALLAGKPRPARALQRTGGDAYSSPDASVARGRPAGSKIAVKKRGPRLEIDIPPSGFT